MRFLICLLAILAVVATGQKVSAQTSPSETSPKIINARVNGKKLIITGENFSAGAVIMVNGVAQKTKNDGDNPTTMLVAKKAGKKISNNEVVNLSVKNTTGQASDVFGFFKGRIITLADGGKTIEFSVGEKFLLLLSKTPYKWEASAQNTAIIRVVDDVLPVAGAVAVFEAVGKGQTDLTALGSLACHNSNPPCMAPSLQFQVTIAVK